MRRVALAILVSLAACGEDEHVPDSVIPDAETSAPDAAAFVSHVELTSASVEPEDGFGASLALSGDTLVIGAPYQDDLAGGAYVFRRTGDTWTEQAHLVPTVPVDRGRFGAAVAIDGDTVVVGAPDTSGPPGVPYPAGRAYVFTRTGEAWSQQAELQAADSGVDDDAGRAVAIDGDTIVFAASAHAALPGAAYVFTGSGATWTEQATLTGDKVDFASAVAIDDGTIVVGARYEDADELGAGYVFVGAGATWTQEAKLIASSEIALSDFGSSVAISGETVALGAPGGGETVKASGEVAVFVRAGTAWTEQADLESGSPDEYGYFSDVALAGDLLAVGAPGESSNAGAVYVFERRAEAWAPIAILHAPEPEELGRFATTALSGDVLVVGAPGQDAVFVYDR